MKKPKIGNLGETMHIRTILRTVAFLTLTAFGTTAMAQEVIRLRIAAGNLREGARLLWPTRSGATERSPARRPLQRA